MIQSLGLVNTAGATEPVQATRNLRTANQRVGCQTIRFAARPTNTGIITIGLMGFTDSSPAIDGFQPIGFLPVPASATQGPFPYLDFIVPNIPAGLNAAEFFIIGAGGNGVYVTILGQ